jgi:hypothetical protein
MLLALLHLWQNAFNSHFASIFVNGELLTLPSVSFTESMEAFAFWRLLETALLLWIWSVGVQCLWFQLWTSCGRYTDQRISCTHLCLLVVDTTIEPWSLLPATWYVPGTVSPSGTVDTSQGSVWGRLLRTVGTPLADPQSCSWNVLLTIVTSSRYSGRLRKAQQNRFHEVLDVAGALHWWKGMTVYRRN